MPKFEIPSIELPEEAAKPIYAGVGATDAVVGYVRTAVTELQKRLADYQKDMQTRLDDFDFEPKALRDQALAVVTEQVDALSQDAKVRREAIEKRVAELQAEAAGLPARLQELWAQNADVVTATYADLVKRGEVLVGRISAQESTQETVSAAKTTTAKAKTTRTQATKAAKKTTKSTTKKATSTAKKTSAAPKSSAKATKTAAKKTASSTAAAATDAATKVGD